MAGKLTLDIFADYYSLQAIISDRRSVDHPEIVAEARNLLARISTPIADCLADYMYLICMGEARHAVGNSNLWCWSEIPKADGRIGAYKFAGEYDPLKTLPQLSELFGQSGWGGSYGGAKWKSIANIALSFRKGELAAPVYIDHVADLKHNGGTQFNKSEASMVIPFELSWKSDYYKLDSFLTYKRDTTDYFANISRNYFRSLSLPVGRLVIQYMQRLRLKPDNWEARPVIEYTPFKFGDKELAKKSGAGTTKSSSSSSSSSSKKVEKLDESMYLSEDEMYDPKEIKYEPAKHDEQPTKQHSAGDAAPAVPIAGGTDGGSGSDGAGADSGTTEAHEEIQEGEKGGTSDKFSDWLLHASSKLP